MFLKDTWRVLVERAKLRRSLRLLKKQEWSVEFLVYLLSKATELHRKDMHVVVCNGNQELVIYAGLPSAQGIVQKEKELDLMDERVRLQALLDSAEIQGVL